MTRIHIPILALIVGGLCGIAGAADEVKLTVNGVAARAGELKPADIKELVISNARLSITFGKDVNGDFSGTSIVFDGRELAHNLHGIEPRDVDRGRTLYLDYGAGRGHLEVDTVRIIKAAPDAAHFAVIDGHNAIRLERHFLLFPGQSGFYDYVIIRTRPGMNTGEMRTMYRFDRDILDWAYMSERTGQQPRYAELVKLPRVQDETWRFPDGAIYQKYDYCGYLSENPLWGHYGHGVGVFFIPVSTEAYAGGPLRQELIVHQDALILNYIGGGHLGGGGTAAGRTGEKIHGPWFIYFNSGEKPDAIIADAKKAAAAEQGKWPYKWMDEALYPLKRTTVSGRLKVADGRSAAGAWVVLGQGGGDVYTQAGDYIFYRRADEAGRFTLPAVRPGTYTLYAWATGGSITQQLQKDGIEVKGDELDLGEVTWSPPHHASLLWQIGKSDRMAGEFKFGNELRNLKWIAMVPADLTFTIGKSRESEDWYYCQRGGNWDINFTLDRAYEKNAYLTVAIAGGGGRVNILVNGTQVKAINYRSDASIYRSALRGARYGLEVVSFPANLLKKGQNVIRFAFAAGANNNGLMYDTVILEAD